MPRSRLWTAINLLMLLMFLFSVAVQYNDPDPLLWMAVYGLGAAGCVLALLGRPNRVFTATVAAIAALWALTLLPAVLGKVRIGELFEEFEMKNALVEQAREAGGLLIVAAWMLVLTFAARARAGAPRNP